MMAGTRPPSRAGGAGAELTADQLGRLTLLCLPRMSPARMSWLLGDREAPAVVAALRRGRLPHDLGPAPSGVGPDLLVSWQRGIHVIDVESVLAAHREMAVVTLSPLDPGWPLHGDPDPPALLFARGDLDLFSGPARVAIVGTRRCTALGRTVAYRLGADIAAAGGTVVSGLALGIDGSAHRGTLDRSASAIGVVGTGLDVVYPRANQGLWDEVAGRGLLVSEYPAGTRGDRWRFPARNRLIAGFSEAVVVVESHDRGGALSTADEAAARGRPVMAVPGSVLSSASRGTNALLSDGAIPIRDAVDVLGYLGLAIEPSGTESSDSADAGRSAAPAVPAPALPPPSTEPTEAPEGADDDPPALEAAEEGPTPGPDTAADVDPEASAPTETEIRRRILAEAAAGAVHIDQLVVATGEGDIWRLVAIVQAMRAEGLVDVDGSTVGLPPATG